jgi:membrane-associated phospholipid phosphatase
VGLVRVFLGDQLARKTCPCDPQAVNALDRDAINNHSHAAGIAADVTVYGTMAALPLLDLLDLGFSRPLAQDLVVYAETIAIDTAVQNAVNFAVARPRPLTYAGDPGSLRSAEGYLSFYAGHVSTAFAALSAASFTLGRRYQARIWPWVVTALVAGSVAFERVASGHHFPTDVAAGAVAGTTIGIVVPWLHARPRVGLVIVTPAIVPGGLGLAGSF